jgi:hypothetical protein
MMSAMTTRNLVRWLLVGLNAAALLWLVPELLAGERQLLVFELLRLPVIVLLVVVSVLLFRARHESSRRRLLFGLAVISLIVLQSAIAVGFNPRAIVMIVAWGLLAWTEARRAMHDEVRRLSGSLDTPLTAA